MCFSRVVGRYLSRSPECVPLGTRCKKLHPSAKANQHTRASYGTSLKAHGQLYVGLQVPKIRFYSMVALLLTRLSTTHDPSSPVRDEAPLAHIDAFMDPVDSRHGAEGFRGLGF